MKIRNNLNQYTIFALKLFPIIVFGTVLYQCVVLTWQISQKKNVELESLALFEKSYVTKNENGIVKIYWALNGMKQEDPILIEFIRNHVLIKPKNVKSYQNRSDSSMRGQYGQPLQVETILGLKETSKDKKGFFIEAGAADGEGISNTLFFEAKYGWTGLLVEANPDELRQLFNKHRNAYILPHCLSTKPEVEIVTFDVSGEVSGIIVEGKIRPSRVGDDPNRPDVNNERKIQVQCFPLYSVLMALDNPHIDYFSLDIEGAELPVLKSLPWNEISMTVLDVEINHAGKIFPGSREEIQNFIASHGYQFLDSNGGIHTADIGNDKNYNADVDDFFYNKGNNRFL